MRQGREYLAALRDGRTVYLSGERVTDVTQHPAFAGAARTVAGLYDLACDPANDMTYEPDEGGTTTKPANRVFMIPRSREDLTARRLASTKWAQSTCGFFGRGPDHVAGFLAGFAGACEVFGKFGDNVVRYYRQVRDDDLYVTYVIIPPHVDRTQIALPVHDDGPAGGAVPACTALAATVDHQRRDSVARFVSRNAEP